MEEIRIEEQRSEENTVNEQPEKKGSVGFLFDLVSIIATVGDRRCGRIPVCVQDCRRCRQVDEPDPAVGRQDSALRL